MIASWTRYLVLKHLAFPLAHHYSALRLHLHQRAPLVQGLNRTEGQTTQQGAQGNTIPRSPRPISPLKPAQREAAKIISPLPRGSMVVLAVVRGPR